jgi:hypothetical protein
LDVRAPAQCAIFLGIVQWLGINSDTTDSVRKALAQTKLSLLGHSRAQGTRDFFTKGTTMKRFVLPLLAVFALLAGCSPSQSEHLASEQLQALKPCLLDVVFTGNLLQAEACAKDAVQHVATSELTDLLEAYLVQGDSRIILEDKSLLDLLLDLFDFETPRQAATFIVNWINERYTLEPLSLSGLLGMAQAQDEALPAAPKELKDITTLLTPETIALLLLPLTMLITFLAKKYIPYVEGYVTVLVSAFANAATTGITMLLSGEATLGYIGLWVGITFITNQATFWFVVKPERALESQRKAD